MSVFIPDDRRVLIVDDDRAIAEVISMRLAVHGLLTRVFHDGLGVLAQVREFRPHAMVLDINMPIVDGFAVMAQLGAERMAKLPTLVLTARHQTGDVKRAVALGAKDYLAKPFHDAQLLSRVARILRH
ncbi:response regulator transcription factor [Phenylobacterium sp.]|uniref:response regulator transcription factor n=1 Tax=Phenylobacterium sp. TaxID=1871053 RepID=UPI0039836F65